MLKRIVIQHTKELRERGKERESVLVLHPRSAYHNIKGIDLSEIKLLSLSIHSHVALNMYDVLQKICKNTIKVVHKTFALFSNSSEFI